MDDHKNVYFYKLWTIHIRTIRFHQRYIDQLQQL